MKIIQVATLITPDGAYGGPVRVAVNQTRALLAAGHEVDLVAGAFGFGRTLPTEFDGVPVRLFPARIIPTLGFSGTYAPGLQNWLRTNMVKTNVIHVHMGRDMVTLPSALIARKLGMPYVLQTHGMVTPSSHPLAGFVDRRWTVPALKSAKRILFLTPEESIGLSTVAPLSSTLEQLHNGVPEFPEASPIASNGMEVLFLARLHERKRPLIFVELAKQLHALFPSVRFVLAGPDGGEGTAIREAIRSSGISHVLSWEGAIAPERTAERISKCNVYVLPSINEPFPMSVLEALALGKPAVVTNSCGLADAIGNGEAGAVVDATLDSLAEAVSCLLADDVYRQKVGRNAQALARSDFGMNHVVERLEELYAETTAHAR
jgi:glycosyltransferase involved in cell wall biosynthesis